MLSTKCGLPTPPARQVSNNGASVGEHVEKIRRSWRGYVYDVNTGARQTVVSADA